VFIAVLLNLTIGLIGLESIESIPWTAYNAPGLFRHDEEFWFFAESCG